MENKRIDSYIVVAGYEPRKRKASFKTFLVDINTFNPHDLKSFKKDFREVIGIKFEQYNAWDSGNMTFRDLFPIKSEWLYQKQYDTKL